MPARALHEDQLPVLPFPLQRRGREGPGQDRQDPLPQVRSHDRSQRDRGDHERGGRGRGWTRRAPAAGGDSAVACQRVGQRPAYADAGRAGRRVQRGRGDAGDVHLDRRDGRLEAARRGRGRRERAPRQRRPGCHRNAPGLRAAGRAGLRAPRSAGPTSRLPPPYEAPVPPRRTKLPRRPSPPSRGRAEAGRRTAPRSARPRDLFATNAGEEGVQTSAPGQRTRGCPRRRRPNGAAATASPGSATRTPCSSRSRSSRRAPTAGPPTTSRRRPIAKTPGSSTSRRSPRRPSR